MTRYRFPRIEAAILTLFGVVVAYGFADTLWRYLFRPRHFEEKVVAWLMIAPAGVLVGAVAVFLAVLALDWDRQRFQVTRTRDRVDRALAAVERRRRERTQTEEPDGP